MCVNSKAKSDSKLVEKQAFRDYQSKEPNIITYLKKARNFSEYFKMFNIMHVHMEQNFREDLLSKKDSSNKK